MKSIFSHLLSYNNLILLEIVDIVGSSNIWISSEELAKKLSLSLRTVQRYIARLEEIIMKYNGKRNIILESHRGKGIRFASNPESNRLFLKEFIYQEDETVKLLQHLLINKVCSKKSYCEENQISVYSTNFTDSIIKIDDVLSDFNLSMSDGKMMIIGEETQIRRFSYVFFWNLYKFDAKPYIYEKVDMYSVEKSLEFFVIENNFSMTSIMKKEFILSIVISILRYTLGNYVQIKEEWAEYIPHNHLPILTESVTKIFHNHSINSKYEIDFFILCILTRPYAYEPSNTRGKLLSYMKNTSVYKATELAVINFSSVIRTIPTDKFEEALIYMYRSHLSAFLFQFVGNDSNGSIYFDTFFSKELLLYFEEFVNGLFEESHNTIFLAKEYLSKRYFLLASSIDRTIIMGPKVEIWIETDLPFMYEEVLKDLIKNRFTYKYNITFLRNAYIKKPDIKLSTVLYQKEKEQKENVIYINSFLETQDFDRIEYAIQTALLTRKKKNNIKTHSNQD